MYINTCVQVHTFTCTIRTGAHMYVHIYVQMHTCTYIHTCVQVHTFTYMHTYVQVHTLCTCTHAYRYIILHAHMRTGAQMYIHMYKCTHVHAHMCIGTHMYMHTCVQVHTCTCNSLDGADKMNSIPTLEKSLISCDYKKK